MVGETQPQPDPYASEIRQMQGDALLLLKFVAGRFDKSVAPKAPIIINSPGMAPVVTERDAFLRDLSSVLKEAPESLAADNVKAGFLFGAIDYLTCLSKPATIDTIKFTRAYTDAHLPPGSALVQINTSIEGKARYLRNLMRIFYGLCAATLFIVLMMMAHVVSGQRIMANLVSERTELSHVWDRIEAAVAGDNTQTGTGGTAETKKTKVSAAQFCPDSPKGKAEEKDPPSAVPTQNPFASQICGKFNDLQKKVALTYQQLGVWNGATDNFYYFFPIPTWLRPNVILPASGDDPPVLKRSEWEQTELRTEVMLVGLANYGIPVLLGLLGSMVFAFRTINTKIDLCSLDDRDVYQTILRIILGIILGGLVSIVFDFGGVDLSGMKLSLWAIAFLVGYGVQIVFEALDRLVALGASKVPPHKEEGEVVNVPMPSRLGTS